MCNKIINMIIIIKNKMMHGVKTIMPVRAASKATITYITYITYSNTYLGTGAGLRVQQMCGWVC